MQWFRFLRNAMFTFLNYQWLSLEISFPFLKKRIMLKFIYLVDSAYIYPIWCKSNRHLFFFLFLFPSFFFLFFFSFLFFLLFFFSSFPIFCKAPCKNGPVAPCSCGTCHKCHKDGTPLAPTSDWERVRKSMKLSKTLYISHTSFPLVPSHSKNFLHIGTPQ